MREYFVWLAKLITLVVIFLVVIPFFFIVVVAAIGKVASDTTIGDSKKQVAVVELAGIIEGSKDILEELYRQADNKNVKGIVLSINSPGGAVGPSQAIYSAVSKLKSKKPIVAAMGGVAASGGLYAALGASKVLCQPGTMTGSIGVIMQIPNFKRFSDWLGVSMVTIKSGELKDAGNSFRDMTEAEKAFLEGTASQVHEEFIQAVVDGRKLKMKEVREFADGRVILGEKAMELKLVDGYGDVYDAARAVFDILGEPLKDDETPKLFYPADKFGQFRKIMETVSNLPLLTERTMEFRYQLAH